MSGQPATEPSNFDQPSEGYIVIAPLSEGTKKNIVAIQKRFAKEFGEDALWLPKGDQLHITFCHIVTPNVEYQEDRASLFARLRPQATATLQNTVPYPFAIASEFYTIEAFRSAVIIKARDDGSFSRLRQEYIDTIPVPEGTRMPPEIIHSTLLRFREPVDFAAVQKVTDEIMTNFEPFEEVTKSLQLIHEKKIFVQEHEVLEEFPSVYK